MSSSRNSAALLIAVLGLIGCRATPPGQTETKVMEMVKHHVTIRGKAEENPLKPTSENIAAGRVAFSHYCVACHGKDGQNTGVPFALKMTPPVPALASPAVQSYTDGQLKWVIENGVAPSGMPGSKGVLSNEEIWSTVLFLRNLPPAGSVGEPEMYQH